MRPSSPPDRRLARVDAACALFAPVAGSPRECVAVAHLDPEWRIRAVRVAAIGTAHDVVLDVAQIARDALIFGATGVVLAHNHPAGDATPSEADLAVTRRLARALAAVDVALVDHLVLTRTAATSLRTLGLL